jgi:hypothetical protein
MGIGTKNERAAHLVKVFPGGGDVEAALATGRGHVPQLVLAQDGGDDERIESDREHGDRPVGEGEAVPDSPKETHGGRRRRGSLTSRAMIPLDALTAPATATVLLCLHVVYRQ